VEDIFERDGDTQGGSRLVEPIARRPEKWRPDGRTPAPEHYRKLKWFNLNIYISLNSKGHLISAFDACLQL
jgi:hypothetical protein